MFILLTGWVLPIQGLIYGTREEAGRGIVLSGNVGGNGILVEDEEGADMDNE